MLTEIERQKREGALRAARMGGLRGADPGAVEAVHAGLNVAMSHVLAREPERALRALRRVDRLLRAGAQPDYAVLECEALRAVAHLQRTPELPLDLSVLTDEVLRAPGFELAHSRLRFLRDDFRAMGIEARAAEAMFELIDLASAA